MARRLFGGVQEPFSGKAEALRESARRRLRVFTGISQERLREPAVNPTGGHAGSV